MISNSTNLKTRLGKVRKCFRFPAKTDAKSSAQWGREAQAESKGVLVADQRLIDEDAIFRTRVRAWCTSPVYSALRYRLLRRDGAGIREDTERRQEYQGVWRALSRGRLLSWNVAAYCSHPVTSGSQHFS